ncbi:ornithine cyclodeaminase family protein [Kocuria sp. KD4]|uniref:ornithine cyclodeaminase family protein n=1 Tax=Kocuria sp. KD4 TaxID=2719588 RepID=UPI001427861B|nr:ornithine cyclodeaminase family protein [Kocuria sp. KD4]QIR69674.1 ornithine cyclodeaminase family protein [Kocuria sp. KD4]
MTTEGSTPQEQCSTGIQGAPAWYTEEQIVRAVPAERARRLLEATLRSGFRPEDDPARSNVPAGEGHLLLMPSVIGDWAGIKVASVSPGNPERDLPRIQATYMLMDSATLSLRALLEGNVLTTLRTPAISAVATDYLAPKEATKLVVFGTGPQALAHIAAFAEIRSFTEVVVCGRTPRKVDAAVDYARTLGLAARSGDASEVRDADVVVCTTSAAEPLFDGALVPDTACVVAMGSHEPQFRELDSALMGRAQVVVEDRATAMREAGDVIQAVADSSLHEDSLVDLADVVTGAVAPDETRPRVFKCVGMSWQDLVVAVGVVDPNA